MLSPILWTKDLQATINFYVQRLGFRSQAVFPQFATLTRDEVQIMVIVPTQPPNQTGDEKEDSHPFFEKPRFTGSLYIFTRDVDALWKAVKDKVYIKEAIGDRQYLMRDFGILDNNGYEIVFGEDISTRLPES
jgi:hypothetical protein